MTVQNRDAHRTRDYRKPDPSCTSTQRCLPSFRQIDMSLDMREENAVILRCFDPVWEVRLMEHGLFKECTTIYVDVA
jgi:hypothetical protein